MSFTAIKGRDSKFLTPDPNTPANLGPGSYDFLPAGDKTEQLKKRLQSRNAGAFMSHELKKTDSHI